MLSVPGWFCPSSRLLQVVGVGFCFYFGLVLLASGLTLGCNNHRSPVSSPHPGSAVKTALCTLCFCVCINHLASHPSDQYVRQVQSLSQTWAVTALLLSQLPVWLGCQPHSGTVPDWLDTTALALVHRQLCVGLCNLCTFCFHPSDFMCSSLVGLHFSCPGRGGSH